MSTVLHISGSSFVCAPSLQQLSSTNHQTKALYANLFGPRNIKNDLIEIGHDLLDERTLSELRVPKICDYGGSIFRNVKPP